PLADPGAIARAEGPWRLISGDAFAIRLDLDETRPGATREAIAFLTDHYNVEDITITVPPLEEVIRTIYEAG
ncbi:MAG: hypothetical protein ABI876_05795, partial [Bacteroidota bacterium]